MNGIIYFVVYFMIKRHRLFLSGLMLICLLTVGEQQSFAGYTNQNFDNWANLSSWGTYTNSDGWIMFNGKIRNTTLWPDPRSEPYSGWLADADNNTNSCLRTPRFTNGIGTITYYCCNKENGENFFSIQYSLDAVTWLTAATVTNSSTSWTCYSNVVDVFDSVYIRFLKVSDTGTSEQNLGLDDIVVYSAPGVSFSGLTTDPASPTIGDEVYICVNAQMNPAASNIVMSALYRFGDSGPYTGVGLVNVSNNLYRATSPVPAGYEGAVCYYVQATYSGSGSSPSLYPYGGSNDPESYTNIGSYSTLGLIITNPSSRAVIQRDAMNYADIRIAGTFTGSVDRVEARAVKRIGYSGASVGWTVIEESPSGGIFAGSLRIKGGGWYMIEVRTIKDGQVAGRAGVDRIGIGEVFIMAGQSNSANYGNPVQNPVDDRVCSYSAGTGWVNANDPQSGAGGTGGSPWPAFGDAIIDKFNVPVGILSRGIGSTQVSQWLPGGYYSLIKDALTFTGTNGVRAILWHQGESDSLAGTSPSNYASMLESIIDQSRVDAGYDVPWGVALASYHPSATASNEVLVIAGQWLVITGGLNKVFLGAQTDFFHLTNYLADSVHFNTAGLTDHGRQWAECVRSNFFPEPSGSIEITNIAFDAEMNLSVGWTAGDGIVCQVQARTNLLAGEWEDVGDWAQWPESHQTLTNLSGAQRFYRVIAPYASP